MSKRDEDKIPPGMMPAPPKFDEDGNPICQLCGRRLVPGVRTGGNWSIDHSRRGVHICTHHAKIKPMKPVDPPPKSRLSCRLGHYIETHKQKKAAGLVWSPMHGWTRPKQDTTN
jgi:hypothetical protein